LPAKTKTASAAQKIRAALDPDPTPPPASDAVPPRRERALNEEPRPPPVRLLSARQVLDRVPLSYPTIWKMMREGKFPRARKISNRSFWIESEIDAYINGLLLRRLKGDDEQD